MCVLCVRATDDPFYSCQLQCLWDFASFSPALICFHKGRRDTFSPLATVLPHIVVLPEVGHPGSSVPASECAYCGVVDFNFPCLNPVRKPPSLPLLPLFIWQPENAISLIVGIRLNLRLFSFPPVIIKKTKRRSP